MKEEFITIRNNNLWEKLSEKFTIEIKPNSVKEYMIFVKNSHAIIYYDPLNIGEAYFTHELL